MTSDCINAGTEIINVPYIKLNSNTEVDFQSRIEKYDVATMNIDYTNVKIYIYSADGDFYESSTSSQHMLYTGLYSASAF